MQGCCYVSSVHTTASNLSLDNEDPQSQCMREWNERESSEGSSLDHQDWGTGEQNVWTNPQTARKDAREKL